MAYAKYASITIDNTKVAGSADLTDFPVLISGTYDGTGGEPDLRSAANGGDIRNTDATGGNSNAISVPADLAFYNDTSATTQYDHEIEEWDAATGKIAVWVRIPTLDYDNDTVFYMHYDDSGVTTSEENINGVWDANYVGVWHNNNSPASAGTIYDSTSSPANMTTAGSMVSGDLVDSKVSKGITWEKASEQYMNTATSVSKLNFTTQSYTMEVVFNPASLSSQSPTFVAHGDGTAYWQYYLYAEATDSFKVHMLSSGGGNIGDTVGLSTSTDYYYAGVRSGTTGYLYRAGSQVATGGTFNNPSSRTEAVTHGYNVFSPSKMYFDGTSSEIRISNTNRSADWISTTNQTIMNPSTFYAMGNETDSGLGGAVSHFGMMMGIGN